jgi:hypothetical protein
MKLKRPNLNLDQAALLEALLEKQLKDADPTAPGFELLYVTYLKIKKCKAIGA